MTSDPLNPSLFHQLQSRFGEVRITNAGQKRVVHRIPNPMSPGTVTTQAEQRGEQYQIACPFCKDHKPRLYVSYQHGWKDKKTGRQNFNLWCCHNEQCHQRGHNRRLFRSMTTIPLCRRRTRSTNPQSMNEASPAPPPAEIVLPSGLIPIDRLPNSHPANAYLLSRGLDPSTLAATWGVSFCDWCHDSMPNPTSRLVIPIYRPAMMFAESAEPQPLALGGWQARTVPGLEPNAGGDSKYIFPVGMQKSELLYGLHLAIAASGPVVVAEGVSDCWQIGPGAVGLFGKTMSMTQKLLLAQHFVDRPIVIMLDADARNTAIQIQHDLKTARSYAAGHNRVVIADLPPHRTDPGECSKDEIGAAITKALQPDPVSITSAPP